jgi:predicted metal-dependent hydrolase
VSEVKPSSTAARVNPYSRTASFPVRKPDFDFSQSPLLFYDDNVLASAFWGVLQAFFPDGERFFIKAVRDCRKLVDDPVLQREIDAFMGQEANHGRAHQKANETVQQRYGIDLESIERRMAKFMAVFNRTHSPLQRLAMTAGAEHFTSTVARYLLRHPEYMAGFRDPAIRKLVLWHVLEEREHRAVAFDLFQRAGGTYWTRAVMFPWFFVVLTPWLVYEIVRLTASLDGFEDRAALERGYASLLGRKGILMKIGPGLRDYFRRDFHPNDDDQSALEAEVRREFGWA